MSPGVSNLDHANRLTSLSDAENSYAFAYNGLGDRLQQTENGVTTNYALDLNAGLTQVLADGTNTYFYCLGRIGQQGEEWAYHLPDALGSVRQLVHPAGAVSYAQNFEPYGEVLAGFGDKASSYGFAGEWTDGTGLQYLRARYYAPEVGRFTSRDTWQGPWLSRGKHSGLRMTIKTGAGRLDPIYRQTMWRLAAAINAAMKQSR